MRKQPVVSTPTARTLLILSPAVVWAGGGVTIAGQVTYGGQYSGPVVVEDPLGEEESIPGRTRPSLITAGLMVLGGYARLCLKGTGGTDACQLPDAPALSALQAGTSRHQVSECGSSEIPSSDSAGRTRTRHGWLCQHAFTMCAVLSWPVSNPTPVPPC